MEDISIYRMVVMTSLVIIIRLLYDIRAELRKGHTWTHIVSKKVGNKKPEELS